MYSFGIGLFCIQFFCNQAAQKEVKCSGYICIPPNYENFNPPSFSHKIIDVSTNFKAPWIQKVDDIEETISLFLDIAITWEEPRLEVNATLQENKLYSLDVSFRKLLWIPDIFIYDAKKLVKNGIDGDLENLKYLSSSNSHFLKYTLTVNVEIVCYRFNFDNYPFDSNDCFLDMGSYSYPKEELIFTELIKETSIYSNNNSFLRSNFLINFEKMPTDRNEKSGYSITGFKINLKRNVNKYIFNYYIPSGLMVITSWVRSSINQM